jgi:hypothetical protein
LQLRQVLWQNWMKKMVSCRFVGYRNKLSESELADRSRPMHNHRVTV